jgi:general secretion pathway protein J
MKTRTDRGFTLVELLLALSIVGALLAMAFAGLRVGLGAWQRGEERAEAQHHGRSLTQVLARSVVGAYPYRAPRPEGGQPVLYFTGEPTRLSFVTVSPPFPSQVPVAFTAVTLSFDEGEAPAFAVRQKVLPNTDPFGDVKPALLDPTVSGIQFRYLRDGGSWEDRWEVGPNDGMPRAVEITVTTRVGDRTVTAPPLTVSLRVTQ